MYSMAFTIERRATASALLGANMENDFSSNYRAIEEFKGVANDHVGLALDLYHAFASLTTEEVLEFQARISNCKGSIQDSANHYNDLQSVLTRVAGTAAIKLSEPTFQPRDPSPLHHGEDTCRIATELMSRYKDRRSALKAWLSDVKKRYPGFKSSDKNSPGYLEHSRVRRHIYASDGTTKN